MSYPLAIRHALTKEIKKADARKTLEDVATAIGQVKALEKEQGMHRYTSLRYSTLINRAIALEAQTGRSLNLLTLAIK